LPDPGAVVFDLDGTLVDTVEARIRAWIEALGQAGFPATRGQIAPLIGVDGTRLAKEVAATAGTPIGDDRAEEIDRSCGQIFDRLSPAPRALPGVGELIAALDERHARWAIATSSRAEQVTASVNALGLSRRPLVIDGSQVRHAKPEPDLLLLSARRLGIDPGRCWYVGDATWDMVSAIAAGMIPIAVTAGSAVDAAALEAAGASAVVSTLGDVVALLPDDRPEGPA